MSKIRLEDNTTLIVQKRIGRGQFSTAYLDESGQVIIKTNFDQNTPDWSKEVYSDISGQHLPEVERLGYTQDFKYQVYKMPYYDKISPNSDAGRIAQILRDELDKITPKYSGGKYTGYQFNHDFIESLHGKIPESVIVDLHSLNSMSANYDSEKFRFEFPNRNIKQDKNGQIILLDVIFNVKSCIKES